jgi:hypothetical protein
MKQFFFLKTNKKMKQILILIALIIPVFLSAQQTNAVKPADTSNRVSFTVKFEMAKMATKDGFMMEGYVVNIGYDEAKKLEGKTIKVTGKYTIVKGLQNEPKELDKDGNEIYKQGRLNDTKRIDSPTIEILD